MSQLQAETSGKAAPRPTTDCCSIPPWPAQGSRQPSQPDQPFVGSVATTSNAASRDFGREGKQEVEEHIKQEDRIVGITYSNALGTLGQWIHVTRLFPRILGLFTQERISGKLISRN